jgi:hypothetical protein
MFSLCSFWRKPRHNFPFEDTGFGDERCLLCAAGAAAELVSRISFVKNVCSSVRQISSIHCFTGRHGQAKLESKIRARLFFFVNRIGMETLLFVMAA